LRTGKTARRATRYRDARRILSSLDLPVITGHFTRWTKMAVPAVSARIQVMHGRDTRGGLAALRERTG